VSPEGYFVGISRGMFAAYLAPHCVLAVILKILHPFAPLGWLVLAACLIGVCLVSSTIGYVVSTLFKDMKTVWPYSALLTNLFGILPPVFYPLGKVAIEWRSAVLLLPTSAAAALVDAAAGLDPITTNEAILGGCVLSVEAIALFAFGIYWARRTAREP